MSDSPLPRRPLEGVRVLELGQLVAAPHACTVLAYFGAEVIKVEPPTHGDPIRTWRVVEDGTSLWWRVIGRNKQCITADLRTPQGRDVVRQLCARVDVLVENFRPGTLEGWDLDPEALRRANPRLIVARVSGYGQTGPLRERPGFASVCEAFGGLRYVTGHPGEIPVRANLSIGDTLAGLHAAMGVMLALYERDTHSGTGQTVDTAITESVFAMMEAAFTEFDRAGVVREPSGTTITGVVPTNTYKCKDGRCVVIGGTGDPVFRRLMRAVDHDAMAEDPRFATNADRVVHAREIDHALAVWTASRTADEVLAVMERAEVPAGPIHSMADLAREPQFNARGMFETVNVDGAAMRVPAIPPKLSRTPGRTDTAGPALGAHTRAVLERVLGMSTEQIEALYACGAV